MRKCTPIILMMLILVSSLPLYSDSLKLADIQGKWQLKYQGNYGYFFHFQKNYRVLCIIYLNTRAVVFKGVYTLEDEKTIRINISEMKTEDNFARLNLNTRFSMTSSSYFIFNGVYESGKGSPMLEISPKKIIIDGNNSEGYFELRIKLKRT